jgi:hypothetical protein
MNQLWPWLELSEHALFGWSGATAIKLEIQPRVREFFAFMGYAAEPNRSDPLGKRDSSFSQTFERAASHAGTLIRSPRTG